MVVNHDVAELYDMDLQGCIIGAAKDIDVAGQVNLKQNDWGKYAVEQLGLDKPFDYFQAGVLILNLDKLRQTASSEEMIQMALTHSYRCHDQDILNIVCKKSGVLYSAAVEYIDGLAGTGQKQNADSENGTGALYEEYDAARKETLYDSFCRIPEAMGRSRL